LDHGEQLRKLVALGRQKAEAYDRENARVHKSILAVKLAAEICVLGEAAEALGLAGQGEYLELIRQPPLVTLKGPENLEA